VLAALVLIGAATLISLPTGPVVDSLPFWCLACGDYGVADALANVALFVPFGWALARTGVRPRVAVAVIVATTIAVETLQNGVIAGRIPSLSDIVANTAGGLVGMSVPLMTRWLTACPRRASLAALGYGASLGVVLLLTLLIQAVPQPGALTWNQSVPNLPGYVRFPGTVREVRLDLPVTVRLTSANPDPRRSEIISTWRSDGSSWMWMDQQDRDLRAHVASLSDPLRMRGLSPWIADAMPAAAGDTVTLAFTAERFSYRLSVSSARGAVERTVRISPADGWRLLVPFERTRERWAPLLAGIWMAALVAPLGYLSAERSATAAVSMAALLVLLPLGLGCAALPFAGWCGAAAGFLTGKGTARWMT